MLPWLSPFSDVCRNLTFQKPAELFAQACEVVPLGYCRGRTFDHCTALLDEAQNASYSQLRMYLTRIGKGGKLILSGDPEQSDVPGEGFLEVVNRLEGLPGIGVVDFGDADIVRHPLIGSILDHLAD
jgi:phosphate starvation-inducible PhoH-like protein